MTTMPLGRREPAAVVADVPQGGDTPARAFARDRGAFEAALARQAQSQATRCGGTGGAAIDGVERTGHELRGQHAGVGAGQSALAERVSAERGAAEPGAAQRGVSGRGPAEAGSSDREREAACTSCGPAPSPRRRGGLEDAAPALPAFLQDTPLPLSAVTSPPLLVAAIKPPASAPRTLAAEAPLATAARRATLAELAASPAAAPQHWQVHITEPALPVRTLDIERAAAGPLTLVVSTTQPVPAHQADKLRRLLAARGAEPLLRGTADRQDEEFPR